MGPTCKWVWRGRIEGVVRIWRVRNRERVCWSKPLNMKSNIFRELDEESNREAKIANLLEMLVVKFLLILIEDVSAIRRIFYLNTNTKMRNSLAHSIEKV